MSDAAGGSGGTASRPRKPTAAERREQRATVDDPEQVLQAGARFLEARPRSVSEVRRKLTGLGYRPELVEGAVDRLTELGLLDDEAFARAWVESRDRAHPRGEHALMLELRQKGIPGPIVATVLRERREIAVRWDAEPAPDSGPAPGAATSADEGAAERLLAKKLPALLREPDPRRRAQRAYALLARNGFAPDVCSSVSRRVVSEAAADEA